MRQPGSLISTNCPVFGFEMKIPSFTASKIARNALSSAKGAGGADAAKVSSLVFTWAPQAPTPESVGPGRKGRLKKCAELSGGAQRPPVLRNEWWARQDSNLQPDRYE